MNITRDYQCLCGHTHEAPSNSKIDIERDRDVCPKCTRYSRAVLSPTPTTFKFADASARKHRQ